MTPLVEVHDEEEVDRAARRRRARHRRQRPQPQDPRGRPRHLRPARPAHPRRRACKIAESGVRGPQDLLGYAAQGADAVLVGEAPGHRRRPARGAVAELVTRRSHRTDPAAGAEHARTRAARRPGRFGQYGGRYVPEALDPRARGARRGPHEGHGRPGVPRRARAAATAPTPAGRASSPRSRGSPSTPAGARVILKREDLNHTGSHKINNVLGAGAADQADGQDAGHRRDRRRPARRRHGHRRGPVRPRVRHLHGRGRHRAAGAQRRPHAAARRRGRPRHDGQRAP